ncbi:hypothetical protein Plhal703r1_c66g0169001 [Plasmopara halstedii]
MLQIKGLPSPQTEQIHVLVVVPKDENDRSAAMALGVAPSLPPTTIHRHPERLKRWAAINEMIRQKNQEGNEKTSTRDTNKKRKNRDIDSSMPYSSLSWTDLEPILSMEDFIISKRVLFLKKLWKSYVIGLCNVKSLLWLLLKLYALCLVMPRFLLRGCERKERTCARSLRVCAEAWQEACIHRRSKRDDIPQGIAQNVAGLEALSDVEGLERTLGIVTNYLEWVFISDDDEKIRRMNTTLKVYGALEMTYSPEQYQANKERINAAQKRYYQRTRDARLSY